MIGAAEATLAINAMRTIFHYLNQKIRHEIHEREASSFSETRSSD